MKDEKKKACSLVLVRDGRRLVGTAAQLAHISEAGGWNAFLTEVATTTLAQFADNYNAAARRPQLRPVGTGPKLAEK